MLTMLKRLTVLACVTSATAIMFGLLVFSAVGVVVSAFAPAGLTPEQKLKAQLQQATEQVFALQVSNARCEATLADTKAKLDSVNLTAQSTALQTKHQTLEAELLKALGATEDDERDWTTLTLKKKAKP